MSFDSMSSTEVPTLLCLIFYFDIFQALRVDFRIVQLAHPYKRKLIIKRGREKRMGLEKRYTCDTRSSRYGDRQVGVSISST